MATRPAPVHSLTSVEAVQFIKRLAGHTDHEIAAELNAAGLRTGSGQPFDVTAVRWVRYIHRIPSAHADAAPGERTIPQLAARLQVGVSAIYHCASLGERLGVATLTIQRCALNNHQRPTGLQSTGPVAENLICRLQRPDGNNWVLQQRGRSGLGA